MYVNKDVAESDPSIMEYFGVMSRHNPPIRVKGTTRLTGGRGRLKGGRGGSCGAHRHTPAVSRVGSSETRTRKT